MKYGLVLEGGAMRGLFTCGVMDVLLENNIVFDGAVGVSAGCVFGCNYKSKQIGRAYRYNRQFCNDDRYCSWKSWWKTGDIYNKDFCYYQVPFQYYPFDMETYKDNPMEFYCVSSNVKTGKPFYFKSEVGDERDVEYMRASASMPLVSNIVEIDGHELLDGGITDSIPLEFFQSIGYQKNIVVLTQARDYQKSPNKLLPIMKIKYHNYPEFIDAVATRHEMYNHQLAYIKESEQKGDTLVIAPSESLHIPHMCKDPKELDRVYQLGRQAALEQLENIKAFLKTTRSE